MKKQIIIIFLSAMALSTENEFNPGLLFTGRVNHQPRTQLNLTPEKLITLPDEFSLSFEVSFHSYWTFGYLFNLHTDTDFRISMTNQSWVSTDSVNFLLIHNNEKVLIKTSIAELDLIPKNWHQFQLDFSRDKKLIEFSINGIKQGKSEILFPNDPFHLVFGYDHQMGDVCHAAKRNIKILSDDEVIHHWPLNETEGKFALNRIDPNSNGIQKWGEWQYPKHSQWTLFKKYNFKGLFNAFGDQSGESVLLSSNDEMILVNPHLNKQSFYTLSSEFPVTNLQYLYDSHDTVLYRQYRGRSNVSAFDFDLQQWSELDTTTFSSQYYGNTLLYDRDNQDIYLTGGYGWFTVKGEIQKYNFEKEKWDTVRVENSEPFNRTPVRNLSGFMGDYLYLGGGHGNESGKQEYGFFKYHDLWRFDKNSLELEKIWEDATLNDSVNFAWIEMNDLQDGGFILYSQVTQSGSKYVLGQFAINEPIIKPLMNLPVTSPFKFMLNFDRQELCLIKSVNDTLADSTHITLYRLAWPPVKPYEIYDSKNLHTALLVILALLILSIILLKNRKNILLIPKKKYQNKQNINIDGIYFQIFGGFKIFQNGINITNKLKLTKQVRQTLLYLILQGYKKKNSIPIVKFSNDFWDTGDERQMTNRRTTLLSRIKAGFKNFPPYPFVINEYEIGFNWSDKNYSTDIEILWNTIKNTSVNNDKFNFKPEKFNEVILILKNGELGYGFNNSWVEEERAVIMRSVRSYLYLCGENFIQNKQGHSLVKIGRNLLTWDEFDEHGISFLVKGLQMTNNYSAASKELEKFRKKYEEEIGEKYSLT